MSKQESVSDSNYFRRPYRVEWTRRLYNGLGQTDPEHETFATSEEAVDCWHDKIMAGYDVMFYTRNEATGEWEE